VPVYAALDGEVVEAHDGEPDRSLEANTTSRGNWVALRHRGTHQTLYFHMHTGSVAVVLGQHVSAGTQLGLAASTQVTVSAPERRRTVRQ
jgi:murein DD-endopeptidase MepM/ murein hydrolase activator NlpD